ncbi:MAG: sporulation transcription factor Spo0A [Clostridiales bacterium]|jgi:two-component system response regulator (stage 0 sporulation protein A)|nr:sporulation transcription factor Spo0A [Clostridiales bacterium]
MVTVLVADANDAICKAIVEFCSTYSDIAIISCVHNGKEALQALKTRNVDAILIDILLPEIDGLSVITQIQSMKRAPTVFVYTAFADTRLMRELQRLNVAYCFIKPMGPEHIIPRMMKLMRTEEDAGRLREEKTGEAISKERLENEITGQIRAIGVPAHLRGYHYLRAAIQYSVEVEDPTTIAVTKDIYPYIAGLYKTQPPLVERSIRNAIEVAWTRGHTRVLNQYFGYTIDDYKGKPTNAEFIAMIADRVRMQLRK